MKTLTLITTLFIAVSAYARDPQAAQPFEQLAATCTPTAPLITIRAVVRAESNFYPNALSINQPKRSRTRLARQPHSKEEAIYWTRWLLDHHYTISGGLMQINSEDAHQHGIVVDQLFDPCLNLQLGWKILTEKYRSATIKYGAGQQALLEALSLYNSGSPRLGFVNGYVARVLHGEFPPIPSSPKNTAGITTGAN